MRSQGLLGFSCCIMLMCHKAVWRCECEEVSGAGDQAMSTITITFYPAPDQSRDLIKLARGVHRNPSRVSDSDNKQTRGKQPVDNTNQIWTIVALTELNATVLSEKVPW